MKIVDPVNTKRLPGMPRGRRACVCGCLVLGPLMVVAVLAILGWVIRGEPLPDVKPDPKLARQLQVKLDILRDHSDPVKAFTGDLMPTVELTQAELNAFAAVSRSQLKSPFREALEAVFLQLDDGQFSLRARVNLDALASETMPYLPLPDQIGLRVDLTGFVGWVEGRGRLVLSSAQIGALSLSGESTLWLARQLYPPAENWIEVMKGFPLPFGTKDLRIEKGRIVLQGN